MAARLELAILLRPTMNGSREPGRVRALPPEPGESSVRLLAGFRRRRTE